MSLYNKYMTIAMLVLCSSSFAELLRRLEGCKVTTMVRDVQ